MTGLLVSEWIEQTGGAERVLDRLAGLFPMPTCCASGTTPRSATRGREVRETWLAGTPLRRHKALALPLMPATWRAPQRGYDWALVSSHAFAHHVNVGSPGVPKYVYVHTPARYLWAPELDARGDNLAARLAGPPLRAIDRRAAQEAHQHRGEQPIRRRPRGARLGAPGHRDPPAGGRRVDPKRRVAASS